MIKPSQKCPYRDFIIRLAKSDYIYKRGIRLNKDDRGFIQTFLVPASSKGTAVAVSNLGHGWGDSIKILDVYMSIPGLNSNVMPYEFSIYLGNKNGWELHDEARIRVVLVDATSKRPSAVQSFFYRDVKRGTHFDLSVLLFTGQRLEIIVDDTHNVPIDRIEFSCKLDLFVRRYRVKAFQNKYGIKYLVGAVGLPGDAKVIEVQNEYGIKYLVGAVGLPGDAKVIEVQNEYGIKYLVGAVGLPGDAKVIEVQNEYGIKYLVGAVGLPGDAKVIEEWKRKNC